MGEKVERDLTKTKLFVLVTYEDDPRLTLNKREREIPHLTFRVEFELGFAVEEEINISGSMAQKY